MINYNMYCFSEYEKDFIEPPIVEYCLVCGEALRVGYDVIRDSHHNYYCNMAECMDYMDDNGIDVECEQLKKVTL